MIYQLLCIRIYTTLYFTMLYIIRIFSLFFFGVLSSSLSSLIMNNIINGKRFVCIYIISQFACIQSLVINPVSSFALLFFNAAAAAADADHFNFLFEKHFERMGKKSQRQQRQHIYIEKNNERDKTNASFNGLKGTIMKRNEMKAKKNVFIYVNIKKKYECHRNMLQHLTNRPKCSLNFLF